MAKERFDVDTGIETAYSEELKVRVDYAQAHAEAQAFAALKASPGWTLLAEFLNTAVASETDKLLEATDLDQIRRHQESVKAFLKVLYLPDQRISHSEELRKHLSDDPALSPDPEDDTSGQS